MYADKITGSMKTAIDETRRRRKIQNEYNQKHDITPKSIQKAIKSTLERAAKEDEQQLDKSGASLVKKQESYKLMNQKERKAFLQELEIQMQIYADSLEFEKAAKVRDILEELES